jgi:hypothetical protein
MANFDFNPEAAKRMQERFGGGESKKDIGRPRKSWLESVGDIAQKYVIDPVESARLPEIGGGILQGAISGATSLANLPAVAAGMVGVDVPRIPTLDLTKYGRQDPVSRAAMLGGELGGFLVPAGAASKGAAALGSLARGGAEGSLAAKMAESALAGFGVSATDEEDKPQLQQRALGGALGAGIEGLSTLTAKSIGKKIAANEKAVKSKFKNEYTDFFNALKESNAGENLRVPAYIKNKANESYRSLSSGAKKVARTFQEEPNFSNAHALQSAIKNDIRKIRAKQPQTTVEPTSVANADKLLKRIQGSMMTSLQNNPELLKRYIDITKRYGKEAAPYNHPAFDKLKSKKISESKLANILIKEKAGLSAKDKSRLLEDILPGVPGFSVRAAVQPWEKQLGQLGLGAAGLAAYELGAPALGRKFRQTQEIID